MTRHPTLPVVTAARAAALLLALTVVNGGCFNFDDASQLRDLRVLAVKSEPAEIMYSPLYLFVDPADRPPPPFFTLDEYDVQVTAYVYEPRGGTVSTRFQLCPEGEGVCDPYEYDPSSEIDTAPEDRREELAAVYTPVEREYATSEDERDRDPAGRITNQTYDYRFSTAVIDSVLRDEEGNAGLNLFSLYPRFVIDAQNPFMPKTEVNQEVAFKRFPFSLNFFDPALPADARDALAFVLGAELCEGGPPDLATYVEEEATCLFERGPNQNPVLLGFDLFDPDAEEAERALTGEEQAPYAFKDEAQLGPFPVLQVNPGAVLNIRPVFPTGTREAYQVFGFNVNAQKLTINNRLEDLALAWHATAGSVPGDSNGEFGNVADVAWALPNARDPGQRDALVVVVRDQRGGVDVGQITVEYR